jgi:beta-xylosidase
MVQTDISQLSAESAEWRQILRNHRLELNDFKKALQETCKNSLTKEQLQEVEHYDNQFHIKLINIHDLKQSIKSHENKIMTEGDHISESTYAEHEQLLNDFLHEESLLQELRNEFQRFVSKTSCL